MGEGEKRHSNGQGSKSVMMLNIKNAKPLVNNPGDLTLTYMQEGLREPVLSNCPNTSWHAFTHSHTHIMCTTLNSWIDDRQIDNQIDDR